MINAVLFIEWLILIYASSWFANSLCEDKVLVDVSLVLEVVLGV